MRYIYQKNAGLGAAINTGLKYIEGEYLCWADPDEFFYGRFNGKASKYS